MSSEFLRDRRVAMEESFFAKQNEALRLRLKEMDEARRKKEAFTAASGITDEDVIEKLASLNIGSDTLAALSVVPLIAVAWADGGIDAQERIAVFSKATELGLDKHNIGYQRIERCLTEKPPPADLFAAWKAYIGALSATLSDEARRTLKMEVLDRARTVAEAAGGFLGVGRKISAQEAQVIKEIESAFCRISATRCHTTIAPGEGER
jgi:tellurite resistance protein